MYNLIAAVAGIVTRDVIFKLNGTGHLSAQDMASEFKQVSSILECSIRCAAIANCGAFVYTSSQSHNIQCELLHSEPGQNITTHSAYETLIYGKQKQAI